MDIATKAAELRSMSNEDLVSMFKDSLKLEALQEGGVDNWDWYGEAIDSYQEKLQAEGFDD